MPPLQQRFALVTGAARGIGRAAALSLSNAGATVWATDVVEDELRTLDRDASDSAGAILTRRMDVSKSEDVQAVVGEIVATGAVIDILANIAGIIVVKPLEETSETEIDAVLDINLRGTILLTRAVIPMMKAAKKGSVINFSSNGGVRAGPLHSIYNASKWGMEGFSRAMAAELADYGIAVNTLTPGTFVRTHMSAITYTAEKKNLWRDPIELGPAFVHLAMQDPSGLNNQHVNAWDLVQALANGTQKTA